MPILDISDTSPIKFTGDPPSLPVPILDGTDYTIPVIYFKTDGIDFGSGVVACNVYDSVSDNIYNPTSSNYIVMNHYALDPPAISGSDDIYVYVGQKKLDDDSLVNFQIYTIANTRDILNFLKSTVDDVHTNVKGINLYAYTKIFTATASYSLVPQNDWALTILDEVYGTSISHFGGGVTHYDFNYIETFDGGDHLPYWVNTHISDEHFAYGIDPTYILRRNYDFLDVYPSIDKDFSFEAEFTVNFNDGHTDEGGAGIGIKTSDDTFIAKILLLTNTGMPESPNKNIVIEGNGYTGVYKVASFGYDVPVKLKIRWEHSSQKLYFYYGNSSLVLAESQAIDWVLTGKKLVCFAEYYNHVDIETSVVPYANISYFSMRYIGQGVGLSGGDVTVPVVKFISPASGSSVSEVTTITIEATNDVGAIKLVEINFDGNNWIACTPPASGNNWTYSWHTRETVNKSYTVGARASA